MDAPISSTRVSPPLASSAGADRWVRTAVCLGAAGLFWLVSVALVLKTSLLTQYFEYARSWKLLWFLAAHACAALLYAAVQARALRIGFRELAPAALVTAALLELLLLFDKLRPVMFAELIGHRLFSSYLQAVDVLVSIALAAASAGVLYLCWHRWGRPGVPRAAVFLPLPLLCLYPCIRLSGLVFAALFVLELYARCFRPVSARGAAGRSGGAGPSQPVAARRTEAILGVAIFLAAFVPRVLYALRVAETESGLGFIWDDAGIYEKGAQDLSYEGYAMFLRAVYSLFGHSYAAVGIVQSLIGATTCLLLYQIAGWLFGRATALITAGLAVVCGPLLFFPALHARETVLTFLLVASVAAARTLFSRPRLYGDAVVGTLVGLLSLLKVVMFPLVVAFVLYRRTLGGGLRHALVIVLVAAGILLSKAVVNRPLDVPVGRSSSEYAAFAYFAGNHPFSREGTWFDLSADEYDRLRSLGFQVGEGAGTPQAIREWKEKYPRIAYCDKVTFENNTWNLFRYNLARPGRMAQAGGENLTAFFLGEFRHHRTFDTVFLLNKSAFSLVFQVQCLVLCAAGWFLALVRYRQDAQRRPLLILITLIVWYFVLVHSVMIGVHSYSVPIIPLLLLFQCSAVYQLAGYLYRFFGAEPRYALAVDQGQAAWQETPGSPADGQPAPRLPARHVHDLAAPHSATTTEEVAGPPGARR
jgi:hypothetical protein